MLELQNLQISRDQTNFTSQVVINGSIVTINSFNPNHIENIPIFFVLGNLRNPNRTQLTSSFQILLLDNYGNLIERQFTGLEYKLLARELPVSAYSVSMAACQQNNYFKLDLLFDHFDLYDSLGPFLFLFFNSKV